MLTRLSTELCSQWLQGLTGGWLDTVPYVHVMKYNAALKTMQIMIIWHIGKKNQITKYYDRMFMNRKNDKEMHKYRLGIKNIFPICVF